MRSSHTSKTFALLIVVIALGLLSHYFLPTWLGKKTDAPDPARYLSVDQPTDGTYWLHYVFQKGARTYAIAQPMKLVGYVQGTSNTSAKIESFDETRFVIEIPAAKLDPAMQGLGYFAVVNNGKAELRTISEIIGTP